jgi:hypothetical protein
MAYDRTEILAQAKQAIQEHELTTIEEVVTHLPCSQSVLYETDEWKVEVLEPIKKALETQRTSLKAKMKKDWRKSDSNPSLQIAAFKLMATDEELEKLTINNNKNQHSGELGITWKEEKTYEANQETDHSD